MEDHNRDDANSQQAVASVFRSINLMSVGVACILGFGMWIDEHSVTVSVLSGVSFYAGIAGLLILWQPGALPSVLINGQREGTIRRRDMLQFHMQMAYVPPPHVVRTAPIAVADLVDPMQTVGIPAATLTESRRFVAPVPATVDTIKVDAANFVTQLFDASTGRPIPHRITKNKGQIQYKSPSNEAIEYLLALEIVKRGAGPQLYWNGDVYTGYPTHRDAINAIRSGVRKASQPQGKQGQEEGIRHE